MKDNYKRKLQLKILEIIKYIDKLCKENDIEYYLIYGSCIGAVRHKGFIPWDDDMDIGMTYENYLKFIDVCKTKLDTKKYFLQTPDTEPNYYLSFIKIRDITTTLVEESNKDIDITYGVYIDIFPLVGVPKSRFKRKILEINRAFALSANRNVINNKFLRGVFKVIKKIIGKKRLLKYCTKECLKYSCNDYENWCSIFDGDGFLLNSTTKKIMGKPTYVKFEDTYLPIPEFYDEYLRHIYGDYMKIPSKEQIEFYTHTPYFYDFNLPSKKYTKKKKILFIIWSFTYGGGAEKILSNIVNNLDYTKYDVSVLEYWRSNIGKIEVNKSVKILTPLITADNDSKIKKLLYKILIENFPKILRRKYIKDNYDVEISFNYMIPTFLLSKGRNKCKTISWIHGDIYDLKENKRKYLLQKRSLKQVNKIVVISNNTLKSIKDIYPEFLKKTTLINNGYDIESIKKFSKEQISFIKKNKYNLLFLGRFDENKNPLFIINVLNELLKRGLDVKLRLLGVGELELDVRKQVSKFGINNNVEILGYKDNPYPYISNSDIIVGCSKSEGFPTVFVEGIILGKPFVSTKVGGVYEISDNEKCGFVATDFNQYVDKLTELLVNRELYNTFSKHAATHALKYSLEAQITKIEKVID